MRWLEAPDIYDDPDPELLEWLRLSKVARFYHKAPWELPDVPIFWIDLGELDQEFTAALIRKAQKEK